MLSSTALFFVAVLLLGYVVLYVSWDEWKLWNTRYVLVTTHLICAIMFYSYSRQVQSGDIILRLTTEQLLEGPDSYQSAEMEDRLAEIIRTEFLRLPSDGPYNFPGEEEPNLGGQLGQATYLDETIFGKM